MKISVILGTRPEGIKLAPVIKHLETRREKDLEVNVCVTGQHRQMLDQVLEVFAIKPDVDLNLMQSEQTLAEFTCRAISSIDSYLRDEQPDWVLVQGDTSTVFCASIAAYYNKTKVGHVEAGLRTGNLFSPWPEEGFRKVATSLGHLHFAPTSAAAENLRRENVPVDKIVVTGNTVVDSLLLVVKDVEQTPPRIHSLPDSLHPMPGRVLPRIVLITGHRRENFGLGLESICRAIAELAESYPDVHFVYPVHLNPNVTTPVRKALGVYERNNIHLIEPLDYRHFVSLMARCFFILSDSGGIQEEAPSLRKPVLIMRESTERPEAVIAGVAALVGSNSKSIVTSARRLLNDPVSYTNMVAQSNPFGDGCASKCIVDALLAYNG